MDRPVPPPDDGDTGHDRPHAGGNGDTARHDRARDGIEHLQSAARELIEAARAMLDVAEDLVDDPEAIASVVGAVGAFGDLVRLRAGVPPRPPAGGEEPSATRPDAPGVERITVL